MVAFVPVILKVAHSLNKKVFVTINTVLQENELEELIQNLDVCRKAKVDAVIVQDLGVAEIVKRYYPEINRISTII